MHRILATSITVLLLPLSSFAADVTAPPASSEESLGGELLDDLSPEVRTQQPAPARDAINMTEGGLRAGAALPRFDDVGDDIGAPSGALSLVRVQQGMQQAESLLGTKATADAEHVRQAGAVQKRVVEQLDKLIAELSKQCQSCGQCQSGDKPANPGQPQQSKPGSPKSAAGKGQTAARDSNTRLGNANAVRLEKGEIDALVKQLWGHLPARDREQMMQSFTEEFLPQYEVEIEQYYRRLSEEPGDNSAR